MAQPVPEPLIPETIGERIRFIRERRRLTQRALARKLAELGVPISYSMLPRFERWGSGDPNARRPGFHHLWAIAKVLDVTLSQLGVTEAEYPELAFYRDPAMQKHIGG